VGGGGLQVSAVSLNFQNNRKLLTKYGESGA
jgi:hypothetical protein